MSADLDNPPTFRRFVEAWAIDPRLLAPPQATFHDPHAEGLVCQLAERRPWEDRALFPCHFPLVLSPNTFPWRYAAMPGSR